MSDAQVIAVYRLLEGPPKGQPFTKTAEECRAALLARYPNHLTVEAIFESGALSTQYRDEAYAEFVEEP